MSDPTVTVLMSVYNGERYLREAVDSIIAQTYEDFEFLIVNDGSTDGSIEVLQSYEDPRIRIINNDVNIGLTKSLNRGVQLARGRYIARMDADDVSSPDRLEKEVQFLDAHPDVGLVGSNVKVIDDDGRDVGVMTYPETSGHIKWYMLFFNPMVHPTLLIRREVFERVGGYNEGIRYAQDYELLCRLAPITRFWNLQDTLLRFRMHSGRVSFRQRADQTRFSDQIKQDYIFSLIGERLPMEGIRAMQESRQGESEELPLIIYSLCKALLRDGSMTAYERKLVRRDAAKKVLYRYDFMRNHNRFEAICRSFELSPASCMAMLAYDLFYLATKPFR